MVASEENSKDLEKFNNKLLEVRNDRSLLESYLLSPLSKITNPGHTSHFKLVKHQQS